MVANSFDASIGPFPEKLSRIDTEQELHPPIKQHPRRLPFAKQEESRNTTTRDAGENDIHRHQPSSPGGIFQSLLRFPDGYNGSTTHYFDIRHRKAPRSRNTLMPSQEDHAENCRCCSGETKCDCYTPDNNFNSTTPPDPWSRRKFEKTRVARILMASNPL
ncbi:hypothetical protein TNCV_2679791 [Trichonephila clavipes]|nr:hypothetical protein TNCV_2679791 [Trichonephila clavipes]